MINTRIFKLLLITVYVVSFSPLLKAQEKTILEEIIVTASKRGVQNVQNIAGGIKAVTGETINEYGLTSFDDFHRLEPSLQVIGEGEGDLQLIIRGIQSAGTGTVGLYFDEMVMTGSNFSEGAGLNPNIRLYDIERVEVLKGPQGTLFGASSMSGTVRILTNKPDTGAFDANISVGGKGTEHGDGSFDVNGMVNVPIIDDTLALRAVAWHEDIGGYIDHNAGAGGVTRLNDINGGKITGGRITIKWTPVERLDVSTFFLAQDTEFDGVQAFDPNIGDLEVTKISQEPIENEIWAAGFTLNYEMPGLGTITGAVSYFDREAHDVFDTTPAGAGLGLPSPAFAGNFPVERYDLSSEIRFSSDFEGPLNFVAGVFYEHDVQESAVDVVRPDLTTGAVPCTSFDNCVAQGIADQVMVFASGGERDLEAWALFGHVEYDVTEKLTLGVGLRYYEADISDSDVVQNDIVPNFPPFFNAGPDLLNQLRAANGLGPLPLFPVIYDVAFINNNELLGPGNILPAGFNPSTEITEASEDELNFDASIAYQHNDSQLYYFKAASGFRPGGINGTTLASIIGSVPASFDPDTVLSFEAGAKTSWFDDRLLINLAYFKMFWDDMHVFGTDDVGISEFVTNAAKSEVDGVEFELAARPADEWYLTFAAAWTFARLTSDAEANPEFPDNPRGLEGDNIPRIPEWAFNGQVEYSVPFQLINNVETVLRMNYSYTKDSSVYFNNSDPFNTRMGDYFLMDISSTFTYRNWSLKLYLNNVTDKRAIVNIDSHVDGFDNFTVRPRSFGAQLSWKYQ